MKTILILLFSFAYSFYTTAQDCEAFFPTSEGTRLEYQHFNAKNKLKSTEKLKLVKKELSGNALILTIDHESFDASGKSTEKNQFTNTCENGVFKFDLKSFTSGQNFQESEGMSMTMTGENLELPSRLQVGMTLKDASLEIKMEVNGMPVMNMKTTITERKVEAIETVTTPAGTFSCYKISYKITVESIMKVEIKGISWYAVNVGAVKSEEYDSNGKLTGYMLLSSLKQGDL